MKISHRFLINRIEKERLVAEQLINKAHSLMFSARMIVAIIPKEGDLSIERDEFSCRVLNIKPLSDDDFYALAYEMQESLKRVRTEIMMFLLSAEDIVARAKQALNRIDCPKEARSVRNTKYVLQDNINILRNLAGGY